MSAGPARWERGELHERVVRFAPSVRERARLPRLVGGALDASASDVDALERELARLGRVMRRDYDQLRVPTAPDRRAAIELAAAGPLAVSVTRTIAELDAATVVLVAVDVEALDHALAAPIAAWAHEGVAAPTAPPLRVIARKVIATQAAALVGYATAPGVADDAVWRTLSAIWQATSETTNEPTALPASAAAAVAVAQLRAETQTRRRGLRALGAELDRRAGTQRTAEVALVIVSRVREVIALGDALIEHVARFDVDVAGWRRLIVAIAQRLGRSLDAIDRLTGMEH